MKINNFCIAVCITAAIIAFFLFSPSQTALATTTCTFTTVGTTMYLDGDCVTDETIFIPDGFTLNGNGYTITAVDPLSGHFLGAVVRNAGATAHVTKLTVTASGLVNVCDPGSPVDTRLRGILFDSASGSITHNVVTGINQGASGCQEGNAIEVRNPPFDGTHPATAYVEIAYNELLDWQKTGIVANGDVNVHIHNNVIGESATQANLAPNSIQLGFGALGIVTRNQVEGNQWFGTSLFAGTAILTFEADVVEVNHNSVRGNSDVALLIVSDNGLFYNNRIVDEGADHPNSCCDVGIWNAGVNNVIRVNKIQGFTDSTIGVLSDSPQALPASPVE